MKTHDKLDRHDILKPDALILILVEQWAGCGMPSGGFTMINDSVQSLLAERLKQSYQKANKTLIDKGVMPTIDLKDRVKRAAPLKSAPKVFPATRPVSDMAPNSGFRAVLWDSIRARVASGSIMFNRPGASRRRLPVADCGVTIPAQESLRRLLPRQWWWQ